MSQISRAKQGMSRRQRRETIPEGIRAQPKRADRRGAARQRHDEPSSLPPLPARASPPAAPFGPRRPPPHQARPSTVPSQLRRRQRSSVTLEVLVAAEGRSDRPPPPSAQFQSAPRRGMTVCEPAFREA